MKDYTVVRRLNEQDMMPAAPQPAEPQDAMPAAQVAPPAPIAPFPGQEPAQPALPAEGESHVPVDPMVMTVKDFLEKCKEIDPLVCMGIETFIQRNEGSFGIDQIHGDTDITFSNAIGHSQPPAHVQPVAVNQTNADLNFPA